MLSQNKHPVILAGGGAVWANAGPEIAQLARLLNCPVITTQQGKGILDERDPLSLGIAAEQNRAHQPSAVAFDARCQLDM